MTDTTDVPDEAGPPEGLELHTNGTVTLHLDGARVRLRRPKAGEYRKLREAHDAYLDLVNEAGEEAQAQVAPMRARAAEAEGTLSAEDRALDRKLGRELVAYGDRLRLGWVLLALTGTDPESLSPEPVVGLAGHRPAGLPEDTDEWPVWLTRGETIAALFKHWQTVPSPRGVR